MAECEHKNAASELKRDKHLQFVGHLLGTLMLSHIVNEALIEMCSKFVKLS